MFAVAGSLIEGAMAIQIIDAVLIAAKSISSLNNIASSSGRVIQETIIQDECAFVQGQITKITLYNGYAISDQQYQQLLMEQVIKVERCCQSLTKYIPSGLGTIFSWILAGQAMRHEFLIIETANHIGLVEYVEKDSKYYIILQFHQKEGNQNIRSNFLKDRPYDRVLNTVIPQGIKFIQINLFINLVIVFWREILTAKPSYFSFDPCHKISKQLARSVFYFCKEPDYHIVLQSIIGCFTDKPMELPRIDMIAVEKTIWHGQKLFEGRRQNLEDLMQMLTTIRTLQI